MKSEKVGGSDVEQSVTAVGGVPHSSISAAVGHDAGEVSGSGGGSAAAAASEADGGRSNSIFELGGVPLSHLVLQLHGRAQVVAMKLPSRETEEILELCRDIWRGWGQVGTAAAERQIEKDLLQQQETAREKGQCAPQQYVERWQEEGGDIALPVILSCRFGRSVLLLILLSGDAVMRGLQKAFENGAILAAEAVPGGGGDGAEAGQDASKASEIQEQLSQIAASVHSKQQQQQAGQVLAEAWSDLLELLLAPERCCRCFQGSRMIGLRAALRGWLRRA
jgi:hypothetical protein